MESWSSRSLGKRAESWIGLAACAAVILGWAIGVGKLLRRRPASDTPQAARGTRTPFTSR